MSAGNKKCKVTAAELAQRCHTSVHTENPHQITNVINAQGVQTSTRITRPALPRLPPAPPPAAPLATDLLQGEEPQYEEIEEDDLAKASQTQVSFLLPVLK
jgi:hypothetical protein